MENKRLLDTLKQLHVELTQAQRVDPETLDLLQDLTQDIERVLSQRSEAAPADAEPASSKLRDLLLKFESEHPELATAVGKVADALAAMGI